MIKYKKINLINFMNNLTIRPAKLGDEKQINQMTKLAHRKKVWPYIGLYKYDREFLSNLKKQIKNPQHGASHFVAINEKDRKIIGFFSYFFEPKTRVRHKICFTWKIHPDHFYKGIGAKLLEYTLKDAKKKGFKKAVAFIVLKNKASIKLALKYGFKIEGLITNYFLTDDNRLEDCYFVGKDL
jgi:L-amino acid N-acyltransferase YncA